MNRRSARPRAWGARRPIAGSRIATCIAMRIATCWSSAPARPGLAAALAASAHGARVILCDEQAELGGSLLAEPMYRSTAGRRADWVREALQRLDRRTGVTLLPRTTAFGWYPDNMIGLVERVTDHLARTRRDLPRERLWHVRAEAGRASATGAIERPLVFPGNDRPGVMLAGAARHVSASLWRQVGKRVVIATSDDSAYAAAIALRRRRSRGRRDCRHAGCDASDVPRASRDCRYGSEQPSSRTERPRCVSVRATLSNGESIACDDAADVGRLDAVGASVMRSRARRLRFDPALACLRAGWRHGRVRCVGACTGTFDLAACVAEGHRRRSDAIRGRSHACRGDAGHPPRSSGTAFVDFQNDVTTKDLRTAAQEGFRPSSMSSATPPPAWRPTRARRRT